ncbi:MAG TPA: choice-of-anchor D domain-containing protein [Polyangia bacterium]|nr:choice-of-anchor D domain-containing protein [Polyangia bacterium]
MRFSAKIAFGFASVICACTGSNTPTAGTETWTVRISGDSISGGSGSLTFSGNGTWKGSWVVEYTGSPSGTVTCPIDTGTFVLTAGGSLTAQGSGTATFPNAPVPNSKFVLTIDGYVADDGTAFGTWTITYDSWPITLSGTWVGLLFNGSGVLVMRPSGPGTGGSGGGALGGTGSGVLGGSGGGVQKVDAGVADAGPSLPLAPLSFTASTTWTQIDLSWLDSANNETGFKVERSLSSTAGYTEVASLPPDATSYSDKGLLPGKTYYYRIYAYNDVGNSKYVTASFTTKSCSSNLDCPAQLNCYQSMCQSPELTPPQKPTIQTEVRLWTEIDFTWIDNANNEAGFKFERSTGGASYAVVATLPPDTTAYSDTGLLPGYTYAYRIYSYNSIGSSPLYETSISTRRCYSNTDCSAGATCSQLGACVGPTPPDAGASDGPVLVSDGGLSVDGPPRMPVDVRPPIIDGPKGDSAINPTTLTISPASATFAAGIGTTSPEAGLYVTNGSSTPTGLLSVSLVGLNSDQFVITKNTCLVPLSTPASGGNSCSISVVFKPTMLANASATLVVTDGTATVTSALTSVVIAPATLAITGAANLGTVSVGQAGTASTYTITNSGGTASGVLTVSLTARAEFSIGSDLCSGLALAAAKTCSFTVTFSPTSAGVKSAVLIASSGGTLLASLQMTGISVSAVALTMRPSTLDFGTISVGTVSGTKTFTVTNEGATASGVLSVVKKDSTSSVGGASQFTYTTTCQAALAPAATCQVVVTFAPTIAGSASAAITVSDGTVSSPAGTVVGIALGRPSITIECGGGSTKTLPDTAVGNTSAPVTCTVTNSSSSSQTTGALTVATTGEFAVATNNCTAALLPTGLAPGLSCTLGLTFSPTAVGQRNGTLTVTSTNGGVASADLTGIGT